MSERPILFSAPMVRAILAGTKTQTRRVVRGGGPVSLGDAAKRCPYWADQLWVRETWQYADWTEDGYPFIGYRADDSSVLVEKCPEEWAERLSDTWAALSAPENYSIDNRAADRRWRPAIHMPRWASRITLRLTSLRVERVQDISRKDEIAEGTPDGMFFDALWDSINANRAPWASNPWVWVVGFERA